MPHLIKPRPRAPRDELALSRRDRAMEARYLGRVRLREIRQRLDIMRAAKALVRGRPLTDRELDVILPPVPGYRTRKRLGAETSTHPTAGLIEGADREGFPPSQGAVEGGAACTRVASAREGRDTPSRVYLFPPKQWSLLMRTTLILTIIVGTFSTDAEAGLFRHRRGRSQCSTPASVTYTYTAAPAAPVALPSAQTQAVEVVAVTADPYGFVAWLNATRAAYGLPAVGWDPNLASWAAVNNSHQAARGLGHFVMGSARRQNAGWGALETVRMNWLASPGHAAALLDPSIRWVGLAGAGWYWTFSAN